jgi:transposase
MIEISPYYKAMRAQLAKQRLEENRCKLKRRGGIIERVFADAKEHRRFRRFTFHGLESVRAQWSLLCTAYNLNKMLRWWRDGKLKLAIVGV